MKQIKILAFDTGGTVLDWGEGVLDMAASNGIAALPPPPLRRPGSAILRADREELSSGAGSAAQDLLGRLPQEKRTCRT
ncbi:MAG TPA: hypothetical protein VGM07_03855 [Stellaceae bacterium]|jgi:hypothetical protein